MKVKLLHFTHTSKMLTPVDHGKLTYVNTIPRATAKVPCAKRYTQNLYKSKGILQSNSGNLWKGKKSEIEERKRERRTENTE